VSTLGGGCTPDISPDVCNISAILVFTATDLEPTIAVQAGDRIDVTVALSFG
jgi:hypothetical protein